MEIFKETFCGNVLSIVIRLFFIDQLVVGSGEVFKFILGLRGRIVFGVVFNSICSISLFDLLDISIFVNS